MLWRAYFGLHDPFCRTIVIGFIVHPTDFSSRFVFHTVEIRTVQFQLFDTIDTYTQNVRM